MASVDPRIDEHIAKAGNFARPILERFRAIVHDAVPECAEAIKWGMPHFTLQGRNLAGMAAFKKHVSIFFHHDDEPAKGGTGPFRQIASVEQMPDEAAIRVKLAVAVKNLVAPAKVARRKVATEPVIGMPDDFAAALDAGTQCERFDAMAPGYRRE